MATSLLQIPVPLTRGIPFNATLGMFHQNWSAIDMYTDYAIWKLLKVTPVQAHMITSGMMFGRKARLLADLIRHSDHPRKSALSAAFKKVRASKRDVLTHSYIKSDLLTVTFMERSIANKFESIEHTYTFEEFNAITQEAYHAACAFLDALAPEPGETNAFVNAALSLDRRSSKSPDRPTSNKELLRASQSASSSSIAESEPSIESEASRPASTKGS